MQRLSAKKSVSVACRGLTFELHVVFGLYKALRIFIGGQAIPVDDDVGWNGYAALLWGRPRSIFTAHQQNLLARKHAQCLYSASCTS